MLFFGEAWLRDSRGLAQGHTGVSTRAVGAPRPWCEQSQAGPLRRPRGPRPGRESDSPLSPPSLPAPGRRRPGAEKRPPPPARSKTSAFRARTPTPGISTPSRAAPPHSRPADTRRGGSGTPGGGARSLQRPCRVPRDPALRKAALAGGRISGGTGRALRTMVPRRWELTGPRRIALPPAAGPGPPHEAPHWGPPPRPWPRGRGRAGGLAGGGAGPRRVPAEQLRPGSLGRGGRGARGADWSPRVSWGRRLAA